MIDTRNKRASAIGCGLLFLACLPLPDGAISEPDRQQAVALYAGISAVSIPTLPAHIIVATLWSDTPDRTLDSDAADLTLVADAPDRTLDFTG